MGRMCAAGDDSRPAAGGPGSAGRAALTVMVGLAGILALHHPMILSGFGRIQSDLGDGRLLNYYLEHGWLWISQAPRHERFWDPPFFHPVPNVMAFSDCMISYGPFYWPFRAVGLAPDTAFGAWLVTMSACNYAAGLLLFRRGLGFGAAASAAAAGLIAFGAPRVNQVHHAQLVPCFYLLFALYALCRIARGPAGGAVERASWWATFGLAVAAQFYGGYYLGWFFGVGLGVAIVAACLFRSTRGRVSALARRDWWAAALGAAVGGVALMPFLAHYLPAAREFGRAFNEGQGQVQPVPWSWWNVGAGNFCWGWIDRRWPVGAMYPEIVRLGLGFATTAACAVGVYLGRRNPPVRAAFAAALFGAAAITFPAADFGAAAACFALAVLFREPIWTGLDAASFALATVLLLDAPADRDVALSTTFALMAFCMFRIWEGRGRASSRALPGAALAALGIHSLPVETAAMLAAPFAAVGVLAACFAPGRRIQAALGTLGLWLAVTAWMSVEGRPWILVQAVLGAALGWAASADRRLRPGPVALPAIVAASLLVVVAPCGSITPWLAVSPYIPGSEAVRMPCRAVLVLLVPAALGLASLIERLDRTRRKATAWGLAVLCLAEQTGATQTFDRGESRRRIAQVASQVDRRAGSFYYRPAGRGDFYYFYHLDAMWAALESGVPTINGISGCFPTGWWDLGEADEPGRPALEPALRKWCDRHGLRRADVQRIDRRAEAVDAKGASGSTCSPGGGASRSANP